MKGGVAGQYESHTHFTVRTLQRHTLWHSAPARSCTNKLLVSEMVPLTIFT